MTESFAIDQTLHGYSDGHRLLASSTELEREAQKTLLTMSDLSGPEFRPGFEEYHTGFGLKTVHKYVVSKTWYAHEMERPGCVWTHSLLVPFELLASAKELGSLLSLFERPLQDGSARGMEDYKETLLVPADRFEAQESARTLQVEKGLFSDVIEGLYGTSKASVFIHSQRGDAFLAECMTVWNGQWPSLRRAFSFCTGAIRPREVGGKLLDLQCVPIDSVVRRRYENVVLLDPTERLNPTQSEWVKTVIEDLSPDSDLHDFLWFFGPRLGGGREGFSSLCRVYAVLQRNRKGEVEAFRVLEEVCEEFPAESSMGELKERLISPGRPYDQWAVKGLDDREFLFWMSTDSRMSCYDVECVGIERIVDRLTRHARVEGARLLKAILEGGVTTTGGAVIRCILREVDPADWIPEMQDLSGIMEVIELVPEITWRADFWLGMADRGDRALNNIVNRALSCKIDTERLVSALIEAGCQAVPEPIWSLDQNEVSRSVLVAISHKELQEIDDIGGDWARLIRQSSRSVLDVLGEGHLSASGVAFGSTALWPYDSEVEDRGIRPWHQYYESAMTDNVDDWPGRGLAFLWVVAINDGTPQASQIGTWATVGITERAVYGGDAESWLLLRRHCKPVGFLRSGERLERWVAGLARAWQENEWSLDELRAAAEARSQFRTQLMAGASANRRAEAFVGDIV